MRDADTDGGLLYYLFKHVVLYLGPHQATPLLLGPSSHCLTPGTRRPLASALRTSWLLDRGSETGRIYRGYPCIYTFLTPRRSSGSSFWFSTHAFASTCLHRCILCREKVNMQHLFLRRNIDIAMDCNPSKVSSQLVMRNVRTAAFALLAQSPGAVEYTNGISAEG